MLSAERPPASAAGNHPSRLQKKLIRKAPLHKPKHVNTLKADIMRAQMEASALFGNVTLMNVEASSAGEVLGHTAILGDEVVKEGVLRLAAITEMDEGYTLMPLENVGVSDVNLFVEAVYGKPMGTLPVNIRPSWPPIHERLENLLYNANHSDVQLILDSPSPTTTPTISVSTLSSSYRLHRFLLALRIPYFTALLTSSFADSSSSTIHLDSNIIRPDAMQLILQYAYTGSLTFSYPPAIDTLILLYDGADYLGMTNLCTYTVIQLYNLSHDLSCACTSCILLVPSIASFARSRILPCLEADCRFVMVKSWDRCVPQRGFADLEAELREEVILGILEKVTVGGVLEMLKQCRMVEKRVEGVTGAWANVVRGVVQRVQERVNELIMERFPSVCRADAEFRRCCENQHWGSDLVEEVLGVAVKGLNEANAVDVLLAIMDIAKPVEGMGIELGDTPLGRARNQCVYFIARKWWSIQQRGLFKDLCDELLFDIAAGIKLDPDTLRNGLDTPSSGLIRGAETRTRLRPMVRPVSLEPKISSSSPPSSATNKRPTTTPLPKTNSRPTQSRSRPNPPPTHPRRRSSRSRSRSLQPTAPPSRASNARQEPRMDMRVIVTVSRTPTQGTVRFIGTTEFANGEWIGLELDQPGE